MMNIPMTASIAPAATRTAATATTVLIMAKVTFNESGITIDIAREEGIGGWGGATPGGRRQSLSNF